jgi:hypothetical protein
MRPSGRPPIRWRSRRSGRCGQDALQVPRGPETEANRHDYRPEYRTSRRVDDPCPHYDCETRPERKRKGARANRHDRNAREEFRRTHGIHQSAARHLRRQGNEAPRRENKADVELRPLMRGEIDRDEWLKAGLHVGEKESEPIQPASAHSRPTLPNDPLPWIESSWPGVPIR